MAANKPFAFLLVFVVSAGRHGSESQHSDAPWHHGNPSTKQAIFTTLHQ